jgi:hypothetical protein
VRRNAHAFSHFRAASAEQLRRVAITHHADTASCPRLDVRVVAEGRVLGQADMANRGTTA